MRHLGYVQIDTIHVIERCHHHILYTRVPDYRREHLDRAQAVELPVRQWTWMIKRPPRALRAGIEAALHSFGRFQLAG